MDKLTLTVLLTVLLTGYTSLLTLLLSMLMITGILDITHISLFCMTLLGVYNIYGLQGLFLLLLSTLSFIVSGYMYITNVSFTDMITSTNNKTDNTEQYYDNLLANVYHKTGITKESIKYITNHYNSISSKYDLFCKFMYTQLCNLRYITENIAGFKHLYDLYDRCMIIKQNINQFQQLFNLRTSFKIPDNVVAISDDLIADELEQKENDINISEIDNDELDDELDDDLDDKLDDDLDDKLDDELDVNDELDVGESITSLPKRKPVINDPFASLFGGSNNLDFNNIMAMNKQMEKQLSNMPPEQKQQLDKMAMNMIGGLFGNINNKTD